MANVLRRVDIVRVLTEAGINFDPEATVVQLRPIYDAFVEGIARENVGDQADEIRDANGRGNVPEDNEDDVDRQIAILRKKRELIQLQQELGQIERRENQRFDFVAFESMVHRFSGDNSYDVHKWFNDVEDAFAVFGCSERDKFVSTRRMLDGSASMLLRTITVNTYEELKAESIEEFGKVFTMQEVFQQLKACVLKPNESVKRYVIEMQEIASRAPVPEPDLIDFIIDGLNDKTNHVSMLYSATTVKELKALLDCYEKKRRSVPVVVKNNNVGSSVSVTMNSTKPYATGVPMQQTVRCYNCFQYGHYQSTCPAPK